MLPEPILRIIRRHPAGLFCRKQAFRAGFGDASLHRWKATGLTNRMAPGWYCDASAPEPPHRRVYLVTEYFRESKKNPKPVVSGKESLRVRGCPLPGPPGLPLALIPRGSRERIREAEFVTMQTQLEGLQVVEFGGHRLATPARALADLDLEEELSDGELLSYFDGARNHLHLRVPELLAEWEEMVQHPGAQRFTRLHKSGLLVMESGGERRAHKQLFLAHPPAPDCQVWVTDRIRVDFAYIFSALVMEYYGEAWHANRVDQDATRLAILRQLGWDVMVITKSMMRDPRAVMEELHERRRLREIGMLEGRLRRPPLPLQTRSHAPFRTLLPLG